MSPFLRQVTTGSGATAVQIVSKVRGQRKILEHIGSAHSPHELAALISIGQQKIAALVGTQEQLDLGIDSPEIAVSASAPNASRDRPHSCWSIRFGRATTS